MDEALFRVITDRLSADEHIPPEAALLVSDALGRPAAEADRPAVDAYLKSVGVQGFRGIGPRAALEIEPGPGLTLVVGRNGSGKSSFADALEVLLTATAFRFNGPALWREGWRNLHVSPPEVSAELLVAGERGVSVLESTTQRTDGSIDELRALAALHAPDAGDVPSRLRRAAAEVREIAGTDASLARHLADLLDAALRMHDEHGDGDCPVCRRVGALDATWHEESVASVTRLREQARRADEAHTALRRATSDANGLLGAPPRVLRTSALDTSEALSAWEAWSSPGTEDPDALAAHIETTTLKGGVDRLRAAAAGELARREDAWRPAAIKLAAWLADARQAVAGNDEVPAIKQAEEWIARVTEDLRNERFAPIAAEAQATWELLRQQSNVEIAQIALEGARTRRHVELAVTVDGVGGAKLGVLSQGELNSVALALFLPRAMLQESPFRFVVIDDPVQSMDPAKVDGLATVLDRVAQQRQVVVFTHDARLREALRRMQIRARVLEVTRRQGSAVAVRTLHDPVTRHLRDAFTLARTDGLPRVVAARVVPGFLRLAIEAACIEAVRRRRLVRGEGHADVEQLFDGQKLLQLVALALFDDASRTSDVYSRLNRDIGTQAVDALKECQKGAHGEVTVSLEKLRQDVENLAGKLQRLM